MKECHKCYWLKSAFCLIACPSVNETLKRMEVEHEESVSNAELVNRKPFQFVEGLGSSQGTYYW